MPTIRIKNKRLPKAQMGEDIPTITFKSPAIPNAATDSLELSDEEKKEEANQQNYQNWLQKPQNEMSVSSWAQPFQQKFNLNPQYDASKKYNKKGNEIKPFDWNKFGRRMGKVGTWGTLGLNAASAAAGYFTDRKKQKDWDSWFRQQNLPDNMYAVSPGNDRGDFDINEGIYRPNQLTPPNVGAAVAQFGGAMIKDTDMNRIKIRIKSGPSNMAYGGQAQGMALGLDLGQKDVYRHMPKEKSEQIRGVIPEAPRSQANIEAEKGETVYGDLDGDGALEHFKIGGKRHVDGGTPLNVPEGSFVFSDTKKMIIKDPEVLEKFGMSPRKEGYTPAEIAKKYDVNKYKAIMEDPNTDYIRKSTAQIMIKSFQKKLAELALIQESMKGFPGGIPQIAKDTHPELAQKYAEEYGVEEKALENEANQQEQVMEQGMTEPEEEIKGEDSMEQSMGEEIPQGRYGGSRLPNYQGATAGSTVYNDSNFASVNPFFQPSATGSTTNSTSTTPTEPEYSQDELQKMYPWYKPYTESKTQAGRISRTTGKSTLFDPNVPNQYKNVDYWVNDAASKGVNINNIGGLQRYIYGELEKDDPTAIEEMWQTWGPTLKSNEKNIENFADMMAGARTADALSRRRQTSIIGYVCTGRDANGQPQIQSSSYKDAGAMTAAGAVSSSTEAEKQCPEKGDELIPPGDVSITGDRKQTPYGWTAPDMVNMVAASAGAPKKYLPYAAKANYEPGRVSLEDWRAQAAARQSMYNKQADVLGVYGPTTGQAAAQSSAAGQQAEGLAGDIAGVTSRNVDRLNQFLQGERQRKDQFNMLGADRATELYKGNVVANQQYDNARRQYINNMAKTFGQGWKNASQLGMLNAVNPMFQVDPFSGKSYFTGQGKGWDRFSRSANNSLATSFPALKNQYMAMGMKEDNAEKMAIKVLTASKQTPDSSSASDYLSEYSSLFS